MKSTSNQIGIPDFNNTQVAFAHKSTRELRKAAWLFSLMNKPKLVQLFSQLGLWAINKKLPFVETMIKWTIFEQFCGGTSLENCQPVIKQLANQNIQTILDYGAEAKETEQDFDATMEQLIRAIDFTARQQNTPVVSMKITGLVKFEILEKLQAQKTLTEKEKESYDTFLKRLAVIGEAAEANSVSLFVDAEESWIQDVIDSLVNEMMLKHNKSEAIIFNTFQMYRHDRLNFLKASFSMAVKGGYILGAKIVRGAYMEKERARALKMGYTSPIQENKSATDRDYNAALEFCLENYQQIAFYNATHNLKSCALQAKIMLEKKIDRQHAHLNFCQLYGMSDQITFNLGRAGFNAMKYVPYGQISEVIPYLIRRAQENTSVSGEMGREYELIIEERKRRSRIRKTKK